MSPRSRKVGIRIAPPDPEYVRIVRNRDGSILYIPVGSAYDMNILMEAVEFADDDTYGPRLDYRHVGVRPQRQKQVKQLRRTIHIKER